MPTTITLDTELVAAVRSATEERSNASAVRKALNEHLRTQRLRELADMAGKVDLPFTNQQIEEMEES